MNDVSAFAWIVLAAFAATMAKVVANATGIFRQNRGETRPHGPPDPASHHA
jgi:hypothetical protein